MTRRKVDSAEQLTRVISTRVPGAFYAKMETWQKDSDCQTIGEFARRMLMREQVIWYHKDATLDSTVMALAGIRNELKAIGTNINQVTRYFNGSSIPQKKIFDALKILDDYRVVGQKVDLLLPMVSEISKKWLQK